MSDFKNPNPQQIADLLKSSKRIAVVGMSSNPERPSNGVSRYLQAHGFEIVPVNPTEPEILGQKCYATLTEIPGKVDIVDVFRRSDQTAAIIEEAIKIGAKAIWLQEGVVNDAGLARAVYAGLIAVQDLCIKKEHHRLAG